MPKGRPKKDKTAYVCDESCVFAVQNQVGKMTDKIGNQKYCMIIQNKFFEGNCGVPEKAESDFQIDQEMWARWGYEDVCHIDRHTCDACVFYKNIMEYKLEPSPLKVRYAWTVERREAQ